MTRDDLEALAKELEQAERGTRRLSANIAVALRIIKPEMPDWVDRNFPDWRATVDGRVAVVHADGKEGVHWVPAPYTESVDAALELVPEEMVWYVKNTGGGVGLPGVKGQWWEVENPDAPACALCAAILRAKAQDT